MPAYLVEQDEYFDRDDPLYPRGLYQFLRSNGTRGDYPDNCARFVFFCRAVLEAGYVCSITGPRCCISTIGRQG